MPHYLSSTLQLRILLLDFGSLAKGDDHYIPFSAQHRDHAVVVPVRGLLGVKVRFRVAI